MSFNVTSLNKNKLSKHTSFFGIRLWILIVTLIVLSILVLLVILSLCIIYYYRRRKSYKANFCIPNPIAPKNHHDIYNSSSLDRRLLSLNISEIEMNVAKAEHLGSTVTDLESAVVSEKLWKGNRFTLREIEVVTNGFADENVVGNGDYGVVYRGVLLGNKRVAVKRLLSNSCPAEDFAAGVEAIGHVRHKNLVKLLGYCMEGAYRMLVYEYINNGNLHQWLHGCLGQVRPLTWDMRMNIIQGVAKGLAYLHEDIEPKIFHQDIKSSNILMDHQWNPKITDFGLAKLVGPEWSHRTSRAMATSGYVACEHASTNVESDVYSFGILMMEIISGRTPVDHNQPLMYLIDWLKSMVANQKIAHVVDPRLPEIPSSKELKRIILISLRCVDPDVKHRPKMGDVIHMLEPRDLLLNDGHRIRRDASGRNYPQESQNVAQSGEGVFNTDEGEDSGNIHPKKENRGNRYQKIFPK